MVCVYNQLQEREIKISLCATKRNFKTYASG